VFGRLFHNKGKEFRAAENKEQQDRQMDNWKVVRRGHDGGRKRKAYTLIAHHSGGSGRFCMMENESDRCEGSGFSVQAGQVPTPWNQDDLRDLRVRLRAGLPPFHIFSQHFPENQQGRFTAALFRPEPEPSARDYLGSCATSAISLPDT